MEAHAEQIETLRSLLAQRRAAAVHHRHALEQIRRALHEDAESDVSTFPPGARLHVDLRTNPELRADLELDLELIRWTDACRQCLLQLADEMMVAVRRLHEDLAGSAEMDATRERQWKAWIERQLCALETPSTVSGKD